MEGLWLVFADVPLRNYSLTHSLVFATRGVVDMMMLGLCIGSCVL